MKHLLISLGLVVGGFFAVCFFAIVSHEVAGPPSPAEVQRDAGNEVSEIAQDIVRQHLKAPTTAKFSETRGAELANGIWYVKGNVDSQNTFGAMLRSKWELLLEKRTRDILSLQIGDQVIEDLIDTSEKPVAHKPKATPTRKTIAAAPTPSVEPIGLATPEPATPAPAPTVRHPRLAQPYAVETDFGIVRLNAGTPIKILEVKSSGPYGTVRVSAQDHEFIVGKNLIADAPWQ
jgi:hypothetical protein